MKWKRSRKAQQESKNKDSSSNSNNNNGDEKGPRERSSNGPSQSSRNGLNEKVMTNLTNSNFHFPKSIDPHIAQHIHPRLNGKEILPNGSIEEGYSSNMIGRVQPNVFSNEGDDMIWRVV